ncbi:hypothetical protein D4764_14G0010030 [Takifugu flavidus]|uniref:Uncharacterized protein n=1 Tax=Takifugu flavidus TaxID=433684 RepID=A0A5C6P9T8_9TELE|nr:hypothetical protein D4764_14G0010030 [Takifugu flavidus]
MVRYLDATEHSLKHGGDSRRQVVTPGELDRAVGGPKTLSRISICSRMSTARALQSDLQQSTN